MAAFDDVVDEALAEMGRQTQAEGVCSICHASVRPDRRERHLNWHASLLQEIECDRLPDVYGGVIPALRPGEGSE